MRKIGSGSAIAGQLTIWRDQRAAVAIEFGLTVGLFIYILASIVDLALMYLTANSLAFALDETARKVMLGDSNVTASETIFIQTLCADSFMVLGCDANLLIDVRPIDPANVVDLSMPTDATGYIDRTALTFDPGTNGNYILARAAVPYQFFTPGLDAILGSTNDGSAVIISSTAFRNEPFE